MTKLSKRAVFSRPLDAPALMRWPTYDWSLALALAIYAVLSLGCLATILAMNQGVLTYTLDDAYIHLSLARNILQGHYGINPQEYAAPSSSVLWPFLLAPLMGLPQPQLVPLALCWVASVGVIVCFHRLASAAFAGLAARRRWLFTMATTVLLIPATNQVGLPWTGMEHSLQVLLAMLVLMGLIRHQRTGMVAWWLGAAIILGPLVRYENLVLSGPALLYLWWHKQRRTALICGGLLFAGLIGFSLFLSSLGLGFLPTSIVAKSFGSQTDSRVVRILASLVANMMNLQGFFLFSGAFLLFRKRKTPAGPVALTIAAAALLHFVVGKFGWFSRYEIYIWATTLAALLFCYQADLAALAQSTRRWPLLLLLVAILGYACRPYVFIQIYSPLGANNVYQQQYQVSRFIAEYYQRPVAVNDLGLATFNGRQYVLDFFGLGSRTALELYERQAPGDWMADLAAQRDVRLAIIYEAWFPMRPSNWIALGDLYLGNQRASAYEERVTFFALDEASAQYTIPRLQQFQTTLPEGVRFVFRSGMHEQPGQP